MNRMKRFLVAFLLVGATILVASESSAEQEVVIEESETIIVDSCSVGSVSDYVDKYLVRLEKTVPSLVPHKQDFSYNYVVIAKDKLKKVVIKDQIPVGATYVSSSPTAQVDEATVTWTLYNLEKDESVSLELVVNASSVADFSNCATIKAYPEACTTTTVGVPMLTVQNTTPSESILIESEVPWNLTVANTGNFCAENVVITSALTDGLTYSEGDGNELIEIGTLAPGESREMTMNTVAVESGEQCNVAVVTASNAESAKDEGCINVLESGIEISVDGPEKQFVGKKATYTLTAKNVGDIPFEDLIITNTAPAVSKSLKAQGAKINRNVATWTIDLDAKEEKSFEAIVTLGEEGTHCNEVSFSTVDSSLNGSDKVCTEWKGYAALLIEVVDTQDPLVVGEETTYIVQIANQGSAADTNVSLSIQLPEGLSAVSASGDTEPTVSGNEIEFAPYPVLKAKEIIQFRVVAKATDVGDLRFKAQMSSDLLKVPVPEEESTQAY